MKMLIHRQNQRGIAMTEYLIILAVVAVAAILIFGLFGQQIKSVVAKSTGAMAGQGVAGSDTQAAAQGNSAETNGMNNFSTQSSTAQ
jgi:type IV pilus assembly protein PilA